MGDAEKNGSTAAKRRSLDDIDWGEHASTRIQAQARDYTPEYEVPPKRRPAAERAGAFSYLAWLVDGATGIVEEVRRNDLGLPEEFWVHYYAARREGLLAVRALLDEWIDGGAEATEQSEREKRRERRGSVNIDF